MARGDVLAFCGLAAIAGLVALGVRNDFDRNHWAAWVQAVGSIAALAVAIFIMAKQSKHAIELFALSESVKLIRTAHSVEALMAYANKAVLFSIDSTPKLLEIESDDRINLARLHVWVESLTDAKKMLQSIPLQELGSQTLIAATISMLEDLTFVINALGDFERAGIANLRPQTIQVLLDTFPSNGLDSYKKFLEGIEELKSA